ncbi:MAG: EamA family transporter [Clostridia bacterium]|nr:EamA family transporter [Clostridia bacterium]
MGYIYLVFSVLAGALNAFGSKKQSNFTSTVTSAAFSSFMRMAASVLTGALLIFATEETYALSSGATALLALASAAVFSAYVILWIFSVRRGAFMLSSVFVMMGVVVTVGLSAVFFQEKITVLHILGLAVLIAASLVMCSYSSEIKGRITVTSIIILILCGALSGIYDFLQKLFVAMVDNASSAAYNFYTYLFTGIILGIFTIVFNRPVFKGEEKLSSVFKNTLPYAVLMGISTLLCYYLKTIAAKYLPSAVIYPMYQGIILPLMSVVSAVFFKEKITVKSAIGIALAIVSVCLINM